MINKLLEEKGITKYRLSKESGVPQTTIIDLCSGKTRIEKCSAETLYRITKVLGVTMESLVEPALKVKAQVDYRVSFENFKSNVCHRVKDCGDLTFVAETIQSDEIRGYYRKKQYAKAFYLLAMVDYLSRENDIPLYNAYDDIREQKLSEPLYPQSIIALANITEDETVKERSLDEAIPEFRKFNIVESEVRDVI